MRNQIVYPSNRNSKIIYTVLEKIQKLYHDAIEMGIQQQENFIIDHLIETNHEISGRLAMFLWDVKNHNLPEPIDDTETYFKLIKRQIDSKYHHLFPNFGFDLDMMIYQIFNEKINQEFNTLKNIQLDSFHLLIINNLQKKINNTLVNNPNFLGVNPWYKRNYYWNYLSFKKLNLEILDEDFNSYIEYFKE